MRGVAMGTQGGRQRLMYLRQQPGMVIDLGQQIAQVAAVTEQLLQRARFFDGFHRYVWREVSAGPRMADKLMRAD